MSHAASPQRFTPVEERRQFFSVSGLCKVLRKNGRVKRCEAKKKRSSHGSNISAVIEGIQQYRYPMLVENFKNFETF